MIKLQKILFVFNIIFTTVIFMFFPLGLYLLIAQKLYMNLMVYLLSYAVVIWSVKNEMKRINSIEIKLKNTVIEIRQID